MSRKIVRCLSLVAAAALGLSPAARAQDEVSFTEPTGWYWYHSQSPEGLASIVQSTGARLIDIEVESASPPRFAAAFVANQGAYAKPSWYFIGITGEQLGAEVNNRNARILDLEVYEDGGQTRFAAVLVSNAGKDARAWWYFYNTSWNTIFDFAVQNGGRIIDIDRYQIGKETLYSGVLIANQGADAS